MTAKFTNGLNTALTLTFNYSIDVLPDITIQPSEDAVVEIPQDMPALTGSFGIDPLNDQALFSIEAGQSINLGLVASVIPQ